MLEWVHRVNPYPRKDDVSTDSKVRSIQVEPELAQAVTSFAWDSHATKSELIRDAIDVLLSDSSQAAGWGPDPGTGSSRLAFIIDDAKWDQLKAAAWLNRTSIAAVVRLAVKHHIS